ncbi:serine/threonine-protein kinase [Aetokthonos hydrillicola]|uniref:serine/threonine-protein kinase n=1 Tax=Aetokthonos hydrillicola TaxID=1550245 RepID=UPI001ABA998D|nr:serine/threonine-protein kinase [Aetokthonos hydrillicola]MBO3462604.1 protein kinase [Aetokthonos hydrillicola CCALA 1050]
MNTLRFGDLLDNRYLIVRNLATGGFGQTYLAEDTRRPGNPVCVVKHLTPASSAPQFLENAKRLFLTEAQTLEQLGKHEQIPRLLAYFEEKHEFYLVQDWIDGYPLTHEFRPGQRWSENKVYQMLQEVLTILQFVHSFGVIHRDIKPDNLIRRRQDSKIVLIDFGIVKQIRTQILSPSHNLNATIPVGTPGYMPTEQGRGNPRPNSDIYALGIIGIQSVTGLNPSQLQEDSQTGEIIWQPWAQISDELAIILEKMVRYHFKDRFQSATEALEALNPLLVKIAPVLRNSVATLSIQQSITLQPTEIPSVVSSPPTAIPSGEPQLSEVSSPPTAIPSVEPQLRKASSPPTAIPSVEPQLRKASSPPTAIPSVEPQLRKASSPPTAIAKNNLLLNYITPLRQAAIVGTGSWLLVIFLVGLLGSVWLGVTFWLVTIAGVIFAYFAKNNSSFDKYSFFTIAIISSLVTSLFSPQKLPSGGLLQAGQPGLFVILFLAIFAGALAFILIIIFDVFDIYQEAFKHISLFLDKDAKN